MKGHTRSLDYSLYCIMGSLQPAIYTISLVPPLVKVILGYLGRIRAWGFLRGNLGEGAVEAGRGGGGGGGGSRKQ